MFGYSQPVAQFGGLVILDDHVTGQKLAVFSSVIPVTVPTKVVFAVNETLQKSQIVGSSFIYLTSPLSVPVSPIPHTASTNFV